VFFVCFFFFVFAQNDVGQVTPFNNSNQMKSNNLLQKGQSGQKRQL